MTSIKFRAEIFAFLKLPLLEKNLLVSRATKSNTKTDELMRTNHTLFFFLLLACITGCKEADTSIHESSEKSESSNFVKQCLSTKECIERLQNEQILLSKSEIKGEELFQVLVFSPQSSEVKGKVQGVTMNMGFIPLQFTPVENGIYTSDAMVGVCTSNKMIWSIDVTIGLNTIVSKQFEVVR